jgi:ATP synthase protein I
MSGIGGLRAVSGRLKLARFDLTFAADMRNREPSARPQTSIVVRCGERRRTGPPQPRKIRRKPLIALDFRKVSQTGRILDSPTPGQYGPRGFQDWQEFTGFARTVAVTQGPSIMADDTSNAGKDGNRSAEEAALSARLQRLGERLGQQARDRKVEAGPPQQDAGRNASMLARGFRLSTELVAGVLVGAFIGWALDKWLGISPWGMIVFLLLGFAAGVTNVVRSAGVSSGPGVRR